MRSLLLALGLLAAPLSFVSPSAAQTIPPCCQPEGEAQHPPDPHNRGPIFVPAEVRRPNERTLTASAEASVEEEAPLANAVSLPVDEPRVVVPITREPIIATDQEAPDFDLELPPCCRVEGETHPPDLHKENASPILVGAKVKSPDERALEAGAEVPILVEVPQVAAIGIPLEARRGLSEPVYRPAPVDAIGSWLSTPEGRAALIAMALLLMLATVWIRWLRRRPKRPEGPPSPPSPFYSGELLLHNLASVPSFKPTKERGFEPA